jgi:hypothetical protein
MKELIFDPTTDFHSDSGGEDPDRASEFLRAHHRHAWSGRQLPGLPEGSMLRLEPFDVGLLDHGLNRTFFGTNEGLYLTSDRFTTWWQWKAMARFQCDSELRERIIVTNVVVDQLGGIVMFPGRMIGGPSINQARGKDQRDRIGDRLDLTLECIRLYYAGTVDSHHNPLGSTLERYAEFFELFGDFAGYTHFWLLQDLITADGEGIRLLLEEDDDGQFDFAGRQSPFPQSVDDYHRYVTRSQEFVNRRNCRMSKELGGTLL